MSENSLFAILLRKPWWISLLIFAVVGLVCAALFPAEFRVVGAMSGLPFAVIAIIAARRQWHLPSSARIEQTHQAVAAMAWPAFSALLAQTFRQDGYTVRQGGASGADFELERKGRLMLVSARRWKSAHTGLEPLRTLQTARDATDAPDALYIGLGPLSDSARAFAAEHRIAVWGAAELAQALKSLPG